MKLKIIGLRSLVFGVVVCASHAMLQGAEISAMKAKNLATEWLKNRKIFKVSSKGESSADTVRTIRSSLKTPLFHIVKLSGGGFIVVAADDRISPVIAFSDCEEFIEDEQNPLWVMLNRDIPMRLSVATASSGVKIATPNAIAVSSSLENTATKTGTAVVEEMRVQPILKSKWDQTTVGGRVVYNYHTPSGMPCGCVATAAAQIMRHHEYPKDAVAEREYVCEISRRDVTLTTIGGIYDWSLMPLVPSSGISDAESEMIGRLVYDVGVASCMSYGYSGSGTISYYTQKSLKSLFHYKQAVYAEQFYEKMGVMGQLENTMLANLDAGYPVMMGISGKDMTSRQNVGHEIVGDGYGYIDDTLYVHLNLGWSGDWDAWYNLPNIDAYSGRVGCNFNLFDDIVYNIFPEDELEIVSGRVIGADGAPIHGANVSAIDDNGNVIATAITSDTGVYAVKVPPNQTVGISAELDGLQGAKTYVTTGKSINHTTYFSDTGVSDFSLSVGNRWGKELVIAAGSCATPVFSKSSCSFVDEMRIDCSQPDKKATIRYTIDGADPDLSSAVWPTNGLIVNATTTLKARTFRKGMAESAVSSITLTDHPRPRFSGGTITWTCPVGASFFKVYKATNRFGAELTECTGWIDDTSYITDAPESVEAPVFYFVSAASQPSDDFASPLSDAIVCGTSADPETGAETQIIAFFDCCGTTNIMFEIPDFPVLIPAVYYKTSGAFGDDGFFKVNVPTTSKKDISLPENSESGTIKTTKVISSAKFGEANGTLFMSDNSLNKMPRDWKMSMWFEQGGRSNYVSASAISYSPVCFLCFQQCAPFVELSQSAISIQGVATNMAFNVKCPREHEWVAVSDSSWLSLSRTHGRGTCPVRFWAESNPDAQTRNATITVTCGTETKTLVVTQGEHEDDSGPVVPGIIQAVATQGTKTSSIFLHWTEVEGAIAYEIYRSAEMGEFPSEPYWTSSNSIPALIDFGTVAGTVYYYQIVAVTEEGRTSPSIAVTGWVAAKVSTNVEEVSFDATGGVVRIIVSSNAGWAAVVDADWIKIEAIDVERNGVLDITAEENLQTEGRTATITLIGGIDTAVPATNVVIASQGAAPAYEAGDWSINDRVNGIASESNIGVAGDCKISDYTARAVLELKNGDVMVTWESQLPEEEQAKHVYTLWGKPTLDTHSQWQKLEGMEDNNRAAMRFFKVSSELKK